VSQLPITPLSPEEQQRIMGQIYPLLEKQVRSYHKHRHMGNNTSVPVELAQDLMESIEYTIGLAGGVYAHANLEEALLLGQEILENKLSKAKSMLDLVNATAPQWQTECRWEAVSYLRHYLEQYDHLHLAHKGPDDLFYPILISLPEGTQGIDSCLFYLNILWIENQIMAGFPDEVLEHFWNRLPAGTLNQCEHLLINGMGNALIGEIPEQLTFTEKSRSKLLTLLKNATADHLDHSSEVLCQWLNLNAADAKKYVKAIVPRLMIWTSERASGAVPINLFI